MSKLSICTELIDKFFLGVKSGKGYKHMNELSGKDLTKYSIQIKIELSTKFSDKVINTAFELVQEKYGLLWITGL